MHFIAGVLHGSRQPVCKREYPALPSGQIGLLFRPSRSRSPEDLYILILPKLNDLAMAAVKGDGAQLAFAAAVELQHDSDVQLSPREESVDEHAVKRLHHKPTIPRTLNHLIGLIGVNSSVVSAWPIFFLTSVLSLSNGGTAGYLVGVLIASIGLIPVYISLAEKIRKYPTSGGQYHWVAALAPPKIRRGLSFYCGFVLGNVRDTMCETPTDSSNSFYLDDVPCRQRLARVTKHCRCRTHLYRRVRC